MKVLLFGASGMLGQGVLRECVLADDVHEIVSIVRTPSGSRHAKVREIVVRNFQDFTPVARELAGVDACFFCLGVSSVGMSEDDYRRVTHDFTLAAAKALREASPGATFVYVSGQGTDSTESGRSMWARVKGKTENDLLALLPKAVMFRPGMVRAKHGIRPRSRVYRAGYAVLGPLLPAAQALFPRHVVSTEQVGRAMLEAARHGASKRVLESPDIAALGT